MAKLEVYKSSANGQWYWRLIAPNGRIIADGSEGYTRRNGVEQAAKRVIRYMRSAMRAEGWKAPLSVGWTTKA